MIKNWKLFLENADDDYSGDVEKDLKRMGQELKNGLYLAFAPMFIGEMFLRFSGKDVKDELKRGVDIIFETIMDQFISVLDSKEEIDEEYRDIMINGLSKAVNSAKDTENAKFLIDQKLKAI